MAGVWDDDVSAVKFSFGPAGDEVGNGAEADEVVVSAVGEKEGAGDAVTGFVSAGVHEGDPEAEAVVAGDALADEGRKGAGVGF